MGRNCAGTTEARARRCIGPRASHGAKSLWRCVLGSAHQTNLVGMLVGLRLFGLGRASRTRLLVGEKIVSKMRRSGQADISAPIRLD